MKSFITTLVIAFLLLGTGAGLLFFILPTQSHETALSEDYLSMISSLVQHLTATQPPAYQPGTLTTIELVEEFKPIPPNDPMIAMEGRKRMLAYRYWIEGKPQKVIDEIHSLSRKTDRDYKLLMAAYIKLDSLRKAEEVGREIKIKDINTLKALAICATTDSGRYAFALDYYRELLKHEDQKTFAYEQIGNVYFKMGKISKAIDNWELAVRQAQSTHRSSTLYLNFALGLAYYYQGNFERAQNHFASIPQYSEYDLAARYYELLILSSQKSKDAKFYFEKALAALRLYGTDEQHDSIIFHYLKAITQRMTEDLGNDNKSHLDSRLAFEELLEAVRKQQRPSSEVEFFAKLLGNILFLAGEDSLAAAFYENVSLPDIYTQMNLLALKPELITNQNITVPTNCESDSCLFYLKLNLANIFMYNKKFHEAKSLSRELDHCGQFVRPSQHKLRDFLLLEHYSKMCDLLEEYYRSQMDSIKQAIDNLSTRQAKLSTTDPERKILKLSITGFQQNLKDLQSAMSTGLQTLANQISELQRKPLGLVVHQRYIPLLRDETDPCFNRKSVGPDIIILFR